MSADDFRRTVRTGRRVGTPNTLLYVARQDVAGPTRLGFIVSKSVGNAVARNLVTRRLRSIGLEFVRSQPSGTDVVVRALPGCAGVTWATLQSEILSGLERRASL